MIKKLKLLRASDYSWAINYLLSNIEDREIAREIRTSNRDLLSIENAIDSLEKTATGRFRISKMQAALRQRRRRDAEKYNDPLTFVLPQETVNQIKKIAKRKNITETDVIAISVMELNEETEFHSRQIRKIQAAEQRTNIQLRENIRSYKKRLDAALELLEQQIRQLLNTEIITSKDLPSPEKIKELEGKINKELHKKMYAARKYIEASGVMYGET
ncbi:hypothetical protein IB234_11710 [Pseudomonas sp. PDM16]|uniref:hypothetical protein n=1 Tax=Pseudomonas sp. PDM16 TaxID=2769292 RepID=UPI00177D62DA|nr:hypothetical protein [Pseudomonas sp. PDM16]MBD9415220.1 hypothetical protein [Pseudomonas sp. PDM16]